MFTKKPGTVDVSESSAFGNTQITLGTAGINWGEELSHPPRVEQAAAAPAAPVNPARARFDEISVRVLIDGKFFDVAVPKETFGESRYEQAAIANKIGGDIGTEDQNLAVANYLLDREAFDLLAKEVACKLTNEEKELLKLHRDKWQKDKDAENRAKEAGEITDKEAALLKVYRDYWVRDTTCGFGVFGVVHGPVSGYSWSGPFPTHGALVVCPSAEPK